jgi:hypothetical protein
MKAITLTLLRVWGLPFTPSLTAKINDLQLNGAFTFTSLAFTTVGTESTEIALLFLVRDVEPCRKRVRPILSLRHNGPTLLSSGKAASMVTAIVTVCFHWLLAA